MREQLRKFFRKYVLKNLALKVVSLAIAILLWWTVGHDPTVEIPITVPLEFHHAPGNLEMDSESPLQAEVTLRGPERLLRQINPSQVHAVLDLEGIGPGQRTFDLTAKQVRVPHNVEVVQVVPAQLHLNFDQTATRNVELQPRVIGNLLSGYSITAISVHPSEVAIVGPKRRVDLVENATTDPVDATGVVGTTTFTTHAYVADPLVRVRLAEPIHVTITTAKLPGRAGQP